MKSVCLLSFLAIGAAGILDWRLHTTSPTTRESLPTLAPFRSPLPTAAPSRPPTVPKEFPTTSPSALAYRLTADEYAETADHVAICVGEFGEGAVVAEWNDLVDMGAAKVNDLADELEIPITFNEGTYFVTKNGRKNYSTSRVYNFGRHKSAPGNWAVHGRVGELTLGSWYGIQGQVLCKIALQTNTKAPSNIALRTHTKAPTAVRTPSPSASADVVYRLTIDEYTETADHGAVCVGEFGEDAVVADWDDLVDMGAAKVNDLADELEIPITFNEGTYFVLKDGNKNYSSSRVYNFGRHKSAPGNWAVHGRVGELTLGSWYGIQGQVLCKFAPKTHTKAPSKIALQTDTKAPSKIALRTNTKAPTTDRRKSRREEKKSKKEERKNFKNGKKKSGLKKSPYRLTRSKYGETQNHEAACEADFGVGAVVADWTDLAELGWKAVNKLVDTLKIPTTFNEKYYFVTRNGAKNFFSGRVYFFERHDGNPPDNWLVHETVGDISLGSWVQIEGKVLCKLPTSLTAAPTPKVSALTRSPTTPLALTYRLTSDEFPETADHESACVKEFGEGAVVSDWKNLVELGASAVTDLVDSLEMRVTFNEKFYYVVNDGEKVWYNTRVYFFERHNGNPPGNWLVHAQVGDISLGSWYDIKGQVLCSVPKVDLPSASPTRMPTDIQAEVTDNETFSLGGSVRASRNGFRGGATVSVESDEGKISGFAEWDGAEMSGASGVTMNAAMIIFVAIIQVIP